VDLVLCHTTVDFDALGAAVGFAKLVPGMRIVLAGGAHPTVQEFLALHRDEYPLIERRAVHPERIRSLVVVDTQQGDRLGPLAPWLTLPQVQGRITVIDHHPLGDREGAMGGGVAPMGGGFAPIAASELQVEAVGAATTLVVERLQGAGCDRLTAAEATVMALGIHVDTGSLTYGSATARDAAALAWLMGQGANVRAIATYVDPALSPPLQELFTTAMGALRDREERGYRVCSLVLETGHYVPGISSLAARLMDTVGCDALFLGAAYRVRGSGVGRLAIVGRSRVEGTDLTPLFTALGGGGHGRAAAATVHGGDPQQILETLVEDFCAAIPHPPTAQDLMSSPVRTIRPDTTIGEARRILLRYGHSGLSVVDDRDRLVGIVSRRDLDIALHHGFRHAPVKGYMSTRLKTIAPDTPLAVIEDLMVTYDIGRLPVLDGAGQLVGIVTRTDVLRQFQRDRPWGADGAGDGDLLLNRRSPQNFCPLLSRFAPPLRSLLDAMAELARSRGWQLYLVGGAVRDLLLDRGDRDLMLSDVDVVVDGCHGPGEPGDGAAVQLAEALQKHYPNARLQIHGQFQTAALLWHKDPTFGSLWVDIATARTEFYPYPAANPEVEASSIRQDLYRRDFTINALAARLTPPRRGELLDYFGGWMDLRDRQVRVLHANSFIEDPTRIFRAVRFATRLGFVIEPQTERYIRYGVAQLPDRAIAPPNGKPAPRKPALETRLKAELKLLLQGDHWRAALALLADLGALRCLHPALHLTADLWRQLRLVDHGWRRLDRLTQDRAASTRSRWDRWELLLETLLASLPPGEGEQVARTLQLTDGSIQRLAQLHRTETQLLDALAALDSSAPVADTVELLDRYDRPLLILMAVRRDRPLRRRLWHYLAHQNQIQAPLNGHDLKQLGYRPGQAFRGILLALRRATLNGHIRDRADALQWLTRHHPPETKSEP